MENWIIKFMTQLMVELEKCDIQLLCCGDFHIVSWHEHLQWNIS